MIWRVVSLTGCPCALGWGKKKKPIAWLTSDWISFGDPGEARTLDPLIKSQLLYQLSYGVIRL